MEWNRLNWSGQYVFFYIVIMFCFYPNTLKSRDRLEWYLPFNAENRQSWKEVRLTKIGKFGLTRKARPSVPEHLHTGIDFKRPTNNYVDEPVYPAAISKVISLRDDGPYAQIIIEHNMENQKVWTVYEHIAGINIEYGQFVNPEYPIARYMSKEELDKYGWQFDHFHFEIMKVKPKPVRPDINRPFRFFFTYCLICYDQSDLGKRYYYPKDFLQNQWRQTTAGLQSAAQ